MAEEIKTIEQAAAELKTQVSTAAKEAADTAVAEVKTAATEAKTDAATALAEAAKANAEIDKIATKMARVGSPFAGEDGGVGSIEKALKDMAPKLAEFREAGKGRAAVSFDIKATITSTGSITQQGTSGVIVPQRLGGIITQPDRPEHVRDIIASTTTTSNLITYVREASYTDGAAITAEGGAKPNSALTLETKFAPVVKIATHFKVSEEALSDLPQLQGYITQRGSSKLILVEDAQLLNGSGTSGNINGIRTQATAFAAGPFANLVPMANNMDVLRAAIAQVRRIEYQPTAAMMHPDDVAAMELTKDADGRYLLPTLLTGNMPMIGRIPIIENTLMSAGNFLVGDFTARATQVFYREGISVRIYDQNEDDALHNLVTIVIEERLALCVYRPEAFVKGVFSTAKTALLPA